MLYNKTFTTLIYIAITILLILLLHLHILPLYLHILLLHLHILLLDLHILLPQDRLSISICKCELTWATYLKSIMFKKFSRRTKNHWTVIIQNNMVSLMGSVTRRSPSENSLCVYGRHRSWYLSCKVSLYWEIHFFPFV